MGMEWDESRIYYAYRFEDIEVEEMTSRRFRKNNTKERLENFNYRSFTSSQFY